MAEATSPCTGICRIEEATGWCEGCARSLGEIVAWGSLNDLAKRKILAACQARRPSRQAPMMRDREG